MARIAAFVPRINFQTANEGRDEVSFQARNVPSNSGRRCFLLAEALSPCSAKRCGMGARQKSPEISGEPRWTECSALTGVNTGALSLVNKRLRVVIHVGPTAELQQAKLTGQLLGVP